MRKVGGAPPATGDQEIAGVEREERGYQCVWGGGVSGRQGTVVGKESISSFLTCFRYSSAYGDCRSPLHFILNFIINMERGRRALPSQWNSLTCDQHIGAVVYYLLVH